MTDRDAVERLARGLEASMGGQDDAATLRALLAAKEGAEAERDAWKRKYIRILNERLSGTWREELDAEAAALREALRRIAHMKPHHAGQTANEYHMQQIALATLDQPKEGDEDEG